MFLTYILEKKIKIIIYKELLQISKKEKFHRQKSQGDELAIH